MLSKGKLNLKNLKDLNKAPESNKTSSEKSSGEKTSRYFTTTAVNKNKGSETAKRKHNEILTTNLSNNPFSNSSDDDFKPKKANSTFTSTAFVNNLPDDSEEDSEDEGFSSTSTSTAFTDNFPNDDDDFEDSKSIAPSNKKEVIGTFDGLHAGRKCFSDSTNAVASVHYGEYQKYNLKNGSLISSKDKIHAESYICNMYKEWARINKKHIDNPHLLSIKISRVPCEPCAKELCALLTEYKNLRIRIKASALTKPGIQGLKYLNNVRKQAVPIYLRAWPTTDVAKKYGVNIDNHYQAKIANSTGNVKTIARYNQGKDLDKNYDNDVLKKMKPHYKDYQEVLTTKWSEQNLSKNQILNAKKIDVIVIKDEEQN